jgi:hypothetical protein
MILTLLDYTQSILSSLNSDEVNSISDTPESLQVAEIIRQVYFNVITRTHLPEHVQFIQFEPSLNPGAPVLMYVPDGVSKITWLKYFNNNITGNAGTDAGFTHDLNVDIPADDTSFNTPPPGYQDVQVLPVTEFINIVTAYNPSETNVESFTFTDSSNVFPGNFTLYYQNDRQPMYCTVISDYYVVFNSFDNTVDSTLQASKCMAYGEIIPKWVMEDNFVPLIDEAQVPLLLNEAKSLAFYELKQTLHQKAEQESKRQWSSVQQDKARSDKPSYFNQLPNFGRYGRSSYAGLSYFKLRGWDTQ